jgi:hypothetical protein
MSIFRCEVSHRFFSFRDAEWYLMNVSEMMKELTQIAELIKLPAARMTAMPSTLFSKSQVIKDVPFPFGHVPVLVQPVFWFGIFVTETFRTKA